MSETAFIDRLKSLITSPTQGFPNALAFQDDICALGQIDGATLICSQDMICENIHFFSQDPLDLIVKKALRVNISDIAAKGAKPYGVMVGLALPSKYHDQISQDLIYQALKEDLALYNIALLGGDTTSSESLTISITIFGLCAYPIPYRQNVQIGDHIYVTGTLGVSKIGLDLRLGTSPIAEHHPDIDIFHQAYLLPDPPLNAGMALAPFMQAAMDISDGLLGDLQKMIDVSAKNLNTELGFTLNYDQIPCAEIENKKYALECALHGGDDYQILFTSQHDASRLTEISQAHNIQISCIGIVKNKKNNKYYNNFSHL